MRAINAAGLTLIKYSEGFRAFPYQDGTGVWTIGYGHTEGVMADTPAINAGQAERFLSNDLADAEAQVLRLTHVPLNDNQYAALVSLTYNIGAAPLEGTLGRLLNAGDYTGAAEEFQKWIHADGEISEGLIRRRAAEKMLFLTYPV